VASSYHTDTRSPHGLCMTCLALRHNTASTNLQKIMRLLLNKCGPRSQPCAIQKNNRLANDPQERPRCGGYTDQICIELGDGLRHCFAWCEHLGLPALVPYFGLELSLVAQIKCIRKRKAPIHSPTQPVCVRAGLLPCLGLE
jgi:hypothetical protein